MAEGVTADTNQCASWSVWWANGHFLMTCLSLNVSSCLPEERTKQRHFLFFAHQLFYWILLIFRVGGWEVSALWRKSHQVACAEQVLMNQTFYFLIPPPLPTSSPFGLMRSRGIECRLLELRLPGWGRTQPESEHVGCQGHGGTMGSALLHPTPWVTGLGHANCQEMCRRWNCCTNWTLQWLVQIPWWPKLLFLCMASALENTEQLDSCR